MPSQVSFCHQNSPVTRKNWTLPWILQELKKYPRKTCGCGQPSGHLIRVLNERSVSDVGNFCLLWLAILKSVWYSVWDTFQLQYSWPWAVVSYTLLAVPWNELEHSHRIFFWFLFSRTNGFVFLLPCFSNLSNATARLFCTLSFAQSCKILSKSPAKSQNFPSF